VLHDVPFHALSGWDDARPADALIDRALVSTAPSLAFRGQPFDAPRAGTVIVGFETGDLPGVAAEVHALGELLPHATRLHGAGATVAATLDAVDGAGCVHFAGHGMYRSVAPERSGIRLADGWLTSARAVSHALRTTTAPRRSTSLRCAEVGRGDEVIGLQRGFLLAGARAVVMTQWLAVDDVACDTVTAFHRLLTTTRWPAHALRVATLQARSRHPHPWWWAPFVCVGAPDAFSEVLR
jgi:CHAT domain-containing protein